MKRKWISFWIVILGLISPLRAMAAELVPVGEVVGLELKDDSVTVVAYDDTVGRICDLKIGDEIVKIDGVPVDSAQDVRTALEKCDDGKMEVVVNREGKQFRLDVCPAQTQAGLRLGVYLRQGITGVGTVTYYDPDTGAFGALGHGVSNSGGELVDMTAGAVYDARVESVDKGQAGTPGQLRGAAQGSDTRGALEKNTARGVFGQTGTPWQGKAIQTAGYDEIKTGPASIRCTVAGETVREYSVEIQKIYPQHRSDGRNLLICVTDPELLEITGGIVQGMSGSPIIQNGKLVGAVTHVLVKDPTRGYGIYIENMLDAAK